MRENPLERLFDDAIPPASLRDRVLRSSHPPVQRRTRWGVALAMAAMLTLAFLGGRATRAAGDGAGPQYLLLLYEGAEYRDDRPTQETVAEYGRWADSLRQERLLTSAHKLDDQRVSLLRRQQVAVEPSAPSDPTGMFVVRAGSFDAAAAIARTSPHLKYGGRIVLWRLL